LLLLFPQAVRTPTTAVITTMKAALRFMFPPMINR
jgi:hypothetical protein